MYTTPLSTLISSLSLDHHLDQQNALQQISSWMTADHLSLNSSKTEFLLIGLLLTDILPSPTKFHLSPKPVTITFVNFAISGLRWILQLHLPLLPLSFTPSLITVILSNSPSLNYPVSSRSRTLLLTLSLKLLSPVIITHTLRSLHWLRITERIEPHPHTFYIE